jgi:hypothetical protein
MRETEIKTVARGLREARPGEYPSGGPDSDDGWLMWHACVHQISLQLAATTRRWNAHDWEMWTGQK